MGYNKYIQTVPHIQKRVIYNTHIYAYIIALIRIFTFIPFSLFVM